MNSLYCEYCTEEIGDGRMELSKHEIDDKPNNTYFVIGGFCNKQCLLKYIVNKICEESK